MFLTRHLPLISFLSLMLGIANVLPTFAQQPDNTSPPTEDITNPSNDRPLTQADSILSLEGGKKLMTEASQAIGSGDYTSAVDKLQKARQVFNQLTNFYLELAKSFTGIDNIITEAQRNNAAQTGQMRDEATYQLALVHRAQNQPELAVPLLIQVIRSQNPTTELGKKSYQQLYELGFVDAPFSNTSSK